MKKPFIFLLLCTLLAACASYDNYFKLDANYLARRQLQTRLFDTQDEEKMIIASAQVLQDMGYTLAESEIKLGILTATKDREAGSKTEKIALAILAGLGGTQAVYDVSQTIYATLVTTKSQAGQGYLVRIDFARVIINNQKESRIEQITDSAVYQDFFDKLGQSVFLTANNL